ncbi:MAG: hypothetical protein IPM82_15565 [Saprospiraceae bacterium]|nr:hypothetical protein [Saprospiraceae bacterium]
MVLNAEDVIKRFEILFREPLFFEIYPGYDKVFGGKITPIWWFRGGSSMAIDEFKKVSPTKCLLDWHEVEIERIAVFRHADDNKNFIYVEAKAEHPVETGENIQRTIENQLSYKNLQQEYAEYNGVPIKRENMTARNNKWRSCKPSR